MRRTLWWKTSDHTSYAGVAASTPSPAHRLTAFDLTMLGLGAVLGAGLFADLLSYGPDAVLGGGQFVFIGRTAAHYAGPSVFGSLILAGAGALLTGLCYAEMATMFPTAGGAYTYTRAALGDTIGWLVGWNLLLAYWAGTVAVAIGWSAYLVRFLQSLDIRLSIAWMVSPSSTAPLEDGPMVSGLANVPALLLVLAVTAALWVGLKGAANLNTAMTGIKISTVLIFLLSSLFYIKMDLWRPWVLPNQGVFGAYGWSGVVRGAGAVFFAYLGFDGICTAAMESPSAARDVPAAIIRSLLISLLIYVAIALVLTGNMPYTKLNSVDPMYTVVDESTKLIWLAPFIQLGGMAGLIGLMMVLLLGLSRGILAMTQVVAPGPSSGILTLTRFSGSSLSLLVPGGLAGLAAAFLPLQGIGLLAGAGILWSQLAVCVSVLYLRYARPDLPRPFKAPLGPGVPILAITVSLLLLPLVPRYIWMRLSLWMLIGFGLHIIIYRRRKKGAGGAGPPMGEV